MGDMTALSQFTSPSGPYFWILVSIAVVLALVSIGSSRRRSRATGGSVTPSTTPVRARPTGAGLPLLIALVLGGGIVAAVAGNNGKVFQGFPGSSSGSNSCQAMPGLQVPGAQCEDPVWINARWGAGAIGPPIDRKDITPHWKGRLCRPGLMKLENHARKSLQLDVTNTCSQTVTFAACVSKGSGPQPFNGLHECAQDPLWTPASHLTIFSIYGGGRDPVANTNVDLAVNIFYCSDAMQLNLLVHPLKCIG